MIIVVMIVPNTHFLLLCGKHISKSITCCNNFTATITMRDKDYPLHFIVEITDDISDVFAKDYMARLSTSTNKTAGPAS